MRVLLEFWSWLLPPFALVLAETVLRFRRFRFAPLRLRLLYATFLLNGEAVDAIHEIEQRVERSGLGSFRELFGLYAAAASRPIEEIEDRFGFGMSWRHLRAMRLVLRQRLEWHLGLVPAPAQRLRTITIGADGARENGTLILSPADRPQKRILLTGGSTAFGLFACSDSATIAARLEYHLNTRDHEGSASWIVQNYAFNGATSLQELLVLLQRVPKGSRLNYVVSVSGYNDVEQQFACAEPGVSAQSQAYTDYLQGTSRLLLLVNAWLKRTYLALVLRRFIAAYRTYPAIDAIQRAGASGVAARTLQDDGADPDIYPLY